MLEGCVATLEQLPPVEANRLDRAGYPALVKAMRRPSGDHDGAHAVMVPVRRARGRVPLERITMMRDPVAENLAQAIWRSLGDQVGCWQLVATKATRGRPTVLITKIADLPCT